MKKLLMLLMVLVSGMLTSNEPADLSATSSLASTEGLMSSIVAGHVSAISGELLFHEHDLALSGPQPLLVQRTYCSGDSNSKSLYQSWGFTEPTTIFYSQPEYKGDASALVTTPHGARAKFELRLSDKPKGRTLFNYEPTKGYTNCGSGKISAKTNIKNTSLFLNNADKRGNSGEVLSGDGTKQLYKELKQIARNPKMAHYLLYQEINPDRTKKKFSYDSNGAPISIIQNNWAENLVYGSINVSYTAQNGRTAFVLSSTGKRVTYYFQKKKWSNGKNGWDSYYLNHVESYERPTVKYAYTKSHRHPYHLIIEEKTLPEGRGLKFSYYDKGEDLKDRVKEIQAPIGENGNFLATHRFSYAFNKQHGYLDLINGATDVLDPYNRKTTYHYDKNERLTNIIRSNSIDQGLSIDSFSFESDGNLAGKYLRDPYWNILKGQVFHYDARGNVTFARTCGNVTGKNSSPIVLGGDGKPTPNGSESYGHIFYYGEGNDVLAEGEDNGKGIFYTYHPASSAVASKLVVYEGTQILLREFNDYDPNLFLYKKIVDNGTSTDKENDTGVTFRKITYSFPTSTAPVGLPQQIIEKYLDLSSNEEKQLKYIVNSYSIEGRLTSQMNFDSLSARHYTLQWEYDAHGNITKEVNALGEEIRRSYDKNDNLIFEENTSHGFATHYQYDLMNRLIGVGEQHNDGRSFQTRHTYDLVGNKISTTDHQGHVTYFSYNDLNQLQSITHPAVNSNGTITQAVESFAYDGLGHQIMHKDKLGYEIHTKCNINGDSLQKTYPDGTSEQFEYYPNGALYKTIHKNQSYTLYVRDCLNQVLSEEIYSSDGVLLSQIKRNYKGSLLISEENPEELMTSYAYDGAGRLVEKLIGDSRVTYSYDSFGNVFQEITWISETEAQVREFTYDFKGQILSEVSKNLSGEIFLQTENSYNSFGDKTQVKTGDSLSQYFFSSNQELMKEIDPEGNVTEYLYNYHYSLPGGLVGSQLQTVDAMGNRTIQIQDPHGREIEISQVSSSEMLLSQKRSSYNLEGDLLRVEEDRIVEGQVTSTYVSEWVYNAVHQVVTQKENPGTLDERIKNFTYNNVGEKDSHTKSDGVVLFYTYDAKGLLSGFYSSDNTVSYRYTYNRNDQVTEVEDLVNLQTTHRILDSKGRLESEILGNGLSVSYAYDSLDRRISMSLPDHSEVQYEYDAWNLKSVNYGDVTHEFNAYDATGNLLNSTLPNQSGTLDYTYDLNQRRRSVTHSSFQHTIPENGFDKVGNLISDQMDDPQGSTIRNFGYDDLYQLTSERGEEEHQYAYDSLSNRISKDNSPSVINSLNQLLEQDNVSYTYDLNGNRTSKNDHGRITFYFYDALNRMTSVITPDQHVKYVYDPFDRRLSKQEENYLYDGQNEIGMFNKGKIQELRILSASDSSEHGAAIAININSNLLIPVHDLFGNVAMLLTPEGELSKSYRYSAFGKELNSGSADQNPWRFASKRFDPETGLIYFGRRYYDPEVARWTSPDPAEFVDGANFHAYLRNNPLNRLDAYGLWGESFWEGAYNMGEDCCNIAGGMGQWLHADMEYEYGDDPSAFHGKMQSSWDEWGEFTNYVKESPGTHLGNALAPACMNAYNLDENASFSERFYAYSGATLEVGLLASGVYKGVSAIRGLKNAAATANIAKTGLKNVTKNPCSKVSQLEEKLSEWLGKETRMIKNEAEDLICISKDGTRKVRFDLNRPSPHHNPHGHIEEFINGKWNKSGPIYPTDVPHY